MRNVGLYHPDWDEACAADSAEGALWSAESILSEALDNDAEMTLEMLDEVRNHVRTAVAYFAEYNK